MLVMSSPKTWWTLDGFFYLLHKYVTPLPEVHLFGYDENAKEAENVPAYFYSFGRFEDYPRQRWSDTLIEACQVMRMAGHETFWFMMDDYWIVREVDTRAVALLNQFMLESGGNVLRFDLATDRLYAKRGEPYLYGKNTAFRIRHLDIIESNPNTPYHMSLWSSLWNINLLLGVLQNGESAQEIEINGTGRLVNNRHLRVLGTRQAPLLHTNIIRGGGDPVYTGYAFDGQSVNGIDPLVLIEMREKGVELR